MLVVACSSAPKPPAEEPKTDWADVLKKMALVGLRALVCTDDTKPDPVQQAPDDAGVVEQSP